MSASFSEESARVQRRARVRKVFSLPGALQALPLIRTVMADLLTSAAALARARAEVRRLEKVSSRDWEDRRRLREARDAVTARQATMAALSRELHGVGVTVLEDGAAVGFPTLVNGSLAYLTYYRDDEDIRCWRYRDQARLRPIPPSWREQAPILDEEESEGLET